MNFLKFLGMFLVNSAEDIKEKLEDTSEATRREVRESLAHTKRVLGLGLLTAIGGLFVGITVGYIGYKAESEATVYAGHLILSIGGFVTAVLFAWFWVRALAAGYLLIGVSKLAHLFWQKVPEISRDGTEKFLAWMRGVLLWFLLAYTYAVIVPVWENLNYYVIALTMMTLGYFMVGAWKLDATKVRKPAVLATSVILAYVTVALVAPTLVKRVRNVGSYYASSVLDLGQRQEKLGAADREAGFAQVEDEKVLISNLREEQRQIRKRAVEKCGGEFCNASDRDRHAAIDASIDLLKKGEYWQRANVQGQPLSPVVTGSSPDADAAAPDVAPVEVSKPGRKTKAKAHVAGTGESASDRLPSWKELDAELSKFGNQ